MNYLLPFINYVKRCIKMRTHESEMTLQRK
ncbi:hypothetical protein CIPAW_02G135400 [Carya illinoinensis]|uniref:Uncharacterized protein n=1 Tax=Carya illinoinensis TaxID=32201 RepID=A0A8T1REN9_CARIL|nr:hypothetical protein CIPAW_02G135400 [Carya illinoinensis]